VRPAALHLPASCLLPPASAAPQLSCAAPPQAPAAQLPGVVAPSVVLLDPWLPASSFLGTLRDMGNEQHRFFLHAVAMIGGEPLAKVDMEAYM
jgi:hypothetical protein